MRGRMERQGYKEDEGGGKGSSAGGGGDEIEK